ALIAHERGDRQQQLGDVGVVADREYDARPERGAGRARVLEGELQIKIVQGDEAPGRAAEQNGAQVLDATRELEQLAQRGPEWHFVGTRLRHRTGQAEQLRPGRALGPDLRVGGAALEHDRQHVDQRLDVVDHGGLPEQAALDRERRLVARLAPGSLDRPENRGLLAADVRAGALAQLDVELEAVPEDVVSEQASLAGLLHGVLEAALRERVFTAQVHVAVLAPGGVRGDRHRLDQRERIAL